MHDFSYQQDGLRVWKAFQIGPGKLIPWDEIYFKHQGATDLTTEQENFGFTPRVTHGSAHDNGDAESSCESGQVLECPEPACAASLARYEESEGGKRGAFVFPGRMANQSPNTRIFLPFVPLEKETEVRLRASRLTINLTRS